AWGIQQQTNRELTDDGGNIQYPAKGTTLGNDYNATANITIADPKLDSLQNIDGVLVHPLPSGSPAINAGTSNAGITTDQRGISRDAQPDIGAFEFTGSEVKGVSFVRDNDGNYTLNGGRENSADRFYGDARIDIITGMIDNNSINSGLGKDKLIDGIESELEPSQDAIYSRGMLTPPSDRNSEKFSDLLKLQPVGIDTNVRFDVDGKAKICGFENFTLLENSDASGLSANTTSLSL
ncbi:MAG: hypothetical protein N2235_25815, partial [Fischerella sp.]|nr:hypothetical protein [Fischerella sp.]